MSHAILSPSSASRWLSCTPSARLEQQFPDKTSPFAEEGTLAHKLGELLISEKLGLIDHIDLSYKMVNEIQTHPLYSESMLEYCDEYATFVIEQYSEAQAHTPDALIFLEQKLDMTEYVPEGFGTGDVVIIADNTLTLIDLKYGKGVPVSATENKQLFLYALGALREFDYLYDISLVKMVIYQPRIGNISSYELSVDALKSWADNTLKQKAQLAFDGKGEFVPGNHCQFCKAKAKCKAPADKNLELAKYDFAESEFLTDEEIADILTRADLFVSWINAIQEHALNEAVNNGKKWPGYKLVEGRSVRKIVDAIAATKALLEKGYASEDILIAKLKGITELEKQIGKKEFAQYLSNYIIKPQGKPVLVPATDKRPEFNSAESAKMDFAEN